MLTKQEEKNTDPELEISHRIAEAVEALVLMGGGKEDVQHGTSYFNILERHTDLKEDKLLFSAIIGTISDLMDAEHASIEIEPSTNGGKPTIRITRRLNNRRDLTRVLWGGFLTHYYQGRISVGRGGRKETLEVAVAGAQEQQALLEAYSKRGRFGNLKAAVLGDDLRPRR